ncbi:MAG: helix-turn-helix domain-containing protein [Actinomycetes bacterium]
MLLDTLCAWFSAKGPRSRCPVARARNTVHHRLRRVEALTDRRLTDPTASAELSSRSKAPGSSTSENPRGRPFR